MAPREAIFSTAMRSRSMVDAPGTTWGAMALWTWRRMAPEMRIFSISAAVLMRMAIKAIAGYWLLVRAKGLQSGPDGFGYCFDSLVAVDLVKTALVTVVFHNGCGLGLKGLHAFDEDGFRVVGPLDEGGTINVADTRDRRRIAVDIVDASGG